MKILRIFNPEHDIALASNLSNFTAPKAGRLLGADVGFLPALWSGADDFILARGGVEEARMSWRNFLDAWQTALPKSFRRPAEPLFVSPDDATALGHVETVDPWGWDAALVSMLRRKGVRRQALPSDGELGDIRMLSHRRTASVLLRQLLTEGTIGEAFECREATEVTTLLARYGRVVMKAPWSSSGRGLRFLSTDHSPFETQQGWFRNLIASQGSVMVEPLYNKVKDFALEFCVRKDGSVDYLGLSLFETSNGAYSGNILAQETVKRKLLSRYVPITLVDDVQAMICDRIPQLLQQKYQGPFGIDMMVVEDPDGQRLLHPCVEINFRRTMGHVALALTPGIDGETAVMRIDYDGHYKLSINKTQL